ncbi:hypothetical protein FE391_40685 [Nonomuraea sp. KC401]|uniref:TipAS antibiotic-recognition domain-containing protein n=1 Tax=unclassified Nonomuraea TaxID=2593643 RepID=UPI0010FF084E|nr:MULTISPECIES: TipAS antibiotic-recognition domain-containing protein [unclassified Nonomuraea]NBE99329.1 hypothetical protein [Nonomuraea sp. K271]TLF55477.1 hypothetical protein FE391_40685 [Nonomuraea sp. KC401]
MDLVRELEPHPRGTHRTVRRFPSGGARGEAGRRWGGTRTRNDAQRCAASRSKEDWKRVVADAAGIYARTADVMRTGAPADGEPAIDLAEEHRAHLTRWCYDCTYETDHRFTASIDGTAPGLAGLPPDGHRRQRLPPRRVIRDRGRPVVRRP